MSVIRLITLNSAPAFYTHIAKAHLLRSGAHKERRMDALRVEWMEACFILREEKKFSGELTEVPEPALIQAAYRHTRTHAHTHAHAHSTLTDTRTHT